MFDKYYEDKISAVKLSASGRLKGVGELGDSSN